MPRIPNARADEVRRERRKQPGSTAMAGTNLHVDPKLLDTDNYTYRWGNDKGARMQQLHGNDWDPAPEAAEGGSVTSKVVGTDAGKPYTAVLLRKPKDWHEADKKEQAKPLDEMDAAIRRGDVAAQKTELRGADVYTPSGANIIERA